jgi:hypothetical protein
VKGLLFEQEAIAGASKRLAELFRVSTAVERDFAEANLDYDGIIRVGELEFVFQCLESPSFSSLVPAIESLKRLSEGTIPLVITTFMVDSAKKLCEREGIHWLDLSGNASIHLPGAIIEVEGRPNVFPKRGRPASLFAPKSSRIARWLLMHYNDFISQRDLALATEMDEGFTSRIVSQMEEQRLVERNKVGKLRARDPNLILDAWADEYDFSKHEVRKGHVVARSGEDLAQQVVGACEAVGIEYGLTGLAAAWKVSPFANFRLVTVYLNRDEGAALRESVALREKLSFREESRGANLWLVSPNDEGVLFERCRYQGAICVHPIQIFLDLKSQPERAREAADHLRSELFPDFRANRGR